MLLVTAQNDDVIAAPANHETDVPLATAIVDHGDRPHDRTIASGSIVFPGGGLGAVRPLLSGLLHDPVDEG